MAIREHDEKAENYTFFDCGCGIVPGSLLLSSWLYFYVNLLLLSGSMISNLIFSLKGWGVKVVMQFYLYISCQFFFN